MAKYVAGIDAGTTGTSVMIADLEGNVIGIGYREYPCIHQHVGWVEQDMNLVWKMMCEAAQDAFKKTGVDPKEVGSLGFSSQRGTFCAIDKNWNPLHDSIVWNDARAAGEVMGQIEQVMPPDRYHEISGVNQSALWAYAKYKWVRDKQPELYDKAYKFVNGQEFFLHKLGAEGDFTDPSSLNLNGMMDVATLDWSDELLKAINVDREKLPQVKTPMTQVGVISKQASELTGFAEGMPICTGGGDQQCAAIGSGVVKEGLAEITIGTASVMVAHVNNRLPDPDHAVLFGGHAIPGQFDMEGLAFATGVCLRWWRDVYGGSEIALAKSMNTDPYVLIGMQAEKAPVGCKGNIFFPFFSSQITPYYCDTAKGGMLGTTLIHDRAMMARSIMEGGAFELRMIVEAMGNVLGRPFDAIRLSGGGTKSALWNQIQADMYGVPVEMLKCMECTTLGATILGAAGAGVFSSIEEAVGAMIHPYGMVEPNMTNHAVYSDLFEVFKATFLALRDSGVYNKLHAVTEKHWG